MSFSKISPYLKQLRWYVFSSMMKLEKNYGKLASIITLFNIRDFVRKRNQILRDTQ